MIGDLERAIEHDGDDPPYLTAIALFATGRGDEAAAVCRKSHGRQIANSHLVLVLDAVTALVEKRPEAGT